MDGKMLARIGAYHVRRCRHDSDRDRADPQGRRADIFADAAAPPRNQSRCATRSAAVSSSGRPRRTTPNACTSGPRPATASSKDAGARRASDSGRAVMHG